MKTICIFASFGHLLLLFQIVIDRTNAYVPKSPLHLRRFNNHHRTSSFATPDRSAKINAAAKVEVVVSGETSTLSTSFNIPRIRPLNGDDPNIWPSLFPAPNDRCSRCGLCETSFIKEVKTSCAFLNDGMGRIDRLEEKIHGRRRRSEDMRWSPGFASGDTDRGDVDDDDDDDENNPGLGFFLNPLKKMMGKFSASSIISTNDDVPREDENLAEEGRFGVMSSPMMLTRGVIRDAQWTGVVTGIACSMLESNTVDAVVCIVSKGKDGDRDGDDWSTPEPIIARTKQDVMRGRGVKPSLAPSLKVLDEIRDDPSIKRLLFCGVGCAVQAFRSVEDKLNLDKVYVLGTNCADNSPTPKAAVNFIRDGVAIKNSKRVIGYEFMQDFRVHVKMKKDEENEREEGEDDDGYVRKPYFCLPGSVARNAIASSCLACFDYTNSLADVVVGYMGAPLDSSGRMDQSYQTLTVRNESGEQMVRIASNAGYLETGPTASGLGSHERFASATVGSDSIVADLAGGKVKERGMPKFAGEVMANVMERTGPKGISFARYSIDYHVLRNYLHVLDEWGDDKEKFERSLPQYAKDLVSRYLEKDDSFAALKESILKKRLERIRGIRP